MSNTELGYFFFLLLLAGFFWLSFMFLGLSQQLEQVAGFVCQEMAGLVGNQERAKMLREEYRERRERDRKANRQMLITWGVIFAAVLALWWLRTVW